MSNYKIDNKKIIALRRDGQLERSVNSTITINAGSLNSSGVTITQTPTVSIPATYAKKTWVVANFTATGHTHDDRYYTEAESNSIFSLTGHTHDYDYWNAANDGADSGLDADLWDGNQFNDYLNQSVKSGSTPTFFNVYTTKIGMNSGLTDYIKIDSTNHVSNMNVYKGSYTFYNDGNSGESFIRVGGCRIENTADVGLLFSDLLYTNLLTIQGSAAKITTDANNSLLIQPSSLGTKANVKITGSDNNKYGGDVYIYGGDGTSYNGVIYLGTSNLTDAMGFVSIPTSNMGIGTIGNYGNRLNVSGKTTEYLYETVNISSNYTGDDENIGTGTCPLVLKNTRYYANVSRLINFYVANVYEGNLSLISGNLQINQGSDRRLKKNIEEINSKKALEIINKIEPSYFNWISEFKNKKDSKVAGYIAQQVLNYLPEMTSYDAELDRYMLNKEYIIPFLHAAIKEISKKIIDLEKQLKN
jgi:hypothetical protein